MDPDLRLSICHFMQAAGMKIRLPQVGIATAIVYFHRFFARNSPKEYDPHAVATTCLFLAGKVSDVAVKLSVVMETAGYRWATKQEYDALRDRLLTTERAVLKAIGFDFNSQHPYRFVVSFVKSLPAHGSQELLQIAWNWVNDSLKTTLCLRYRPEQIAAAAVLLSAKLLRSPIYKTAIENTEEPLFCGEKIEVLEEIYIQILDLYENCAAISALKRKRETLPENQPFPRESLTLIKPPKFPPVKHAPTTTTTTTTTAGGVGHPRPPVPPEQRERERRERELREREHREREQNVSNNSNNNNNNETKVPYPAPTPAPAPVHVPVPAPAAPSSIEDEEGALPNGSPNKRLKVDRESAA